MITDLIPYLVATGAAAAGSTTIVLNVGASGGWPVLPGDTVVVSGGAGGALPTGVTDSKGHTYTLVNSRTATTPEAWQFTATATQGLRSDTPDTITVTYAGTAQAKCVVAVAVSGAPVAGVDVVAAAGNGTGSTAPSVATAALAGAGQNEIAVALIVDASTGGAPVWDPGWKPLATAQQGTNPYASVATMVTTGTGAVTASATLGVSAAWNILVLVLKPAAVPQKGMVGASVWSYPDTSVRAGPGNTVANEFDGVVGRKMANNVQRTYYEENAWPATVTSPDKGFKPLADNGIYQVLTFRPLRAAGGGTSAERTNLANALALLKNYIASRGAGAPGFAVTLWHECNNYGQHGPFGDGTQQNPKFLPSPYTGTVSPAQAASNYQDHVQYYGPTVQGAGIALVYLPAVISPAAALTFFPGRALCNAYVIDYYCCSDYYPVKRTEITDCITQASGTMAGYLFSPPLPVGLGEWGFVNGQTKPTTAQFDDWARNHVVAPLLNYVNSGGYLCWMTWFMAGAGNALNTATPAAEITSTQYVYDQLNAGAAGSPVVTTPSLPAAGAGVPYSATLAASGGTSPYTWAVTAGALPLGLALSPAGVISGTPTAAGTSSFTVTVTDSLAATGSAALSIAVAPPALAVPPQSLPPGRVGTPYATALSASGGTPPYSWAVTAGALPAGLSLDPGGTVSGTPTAAGAATFTAQVTDHAAAAASAPFTITVVTAAALVVTGAGALQAAIAGAPYTAPLTAAGGTPPYSWAVTGGALPPGLALDPASGTVSGIPTSTGAGATTYSFTAQVTDSLAATGSGVFSVTVYVLLPPPPPRGPWRILYGLPQPAGDVTGEITQAQSKVITLRTEPGQASQVDLDIDGSSAQAAGLAELETDITVMFGARIIFCGRLVPSQDTLTASAHRTAVSALDYREVLRRRAILPGDTVSWTSVEQATIAWNLIQATQARAGGNLGIAQGAGKNTGVQRTMTFATGDYIADDIDTMAQLNSGFEWQITPYAQSDLRLDIFYPEQGADNGVVLAWGDGRISSITRNVDPSAFADAVYVTGDSTKALTAQSLQAADIGTRPEGRWDTVTGTSLKTQSSLNDEAAEDLARAQVVIPAYTVTLRPGAWDGPEWLWLGDTVTLQISSGRLQVSDKLRVVEMAFAISPDNVETLTLSIGAIPLRLRKVIPGILRNLAFLNTR